MKRLALLATCAMLTLASAADARRSPTPDEATAIAAGFNSDPPSCLRIYVSTIDTDWASVTYGSPEPGESAFDFISRCPLASNGLAMMHQENGSWSYSIDAGSDIQYCPLDPVPTGVALDLHACRKLGRVLIQRGTSYVYRPRRLIQGAHGTYEHLKWSHWGKPSATATGRLEYGDAYEHFTTKVRISASRIQQCLGHRVYSRIHVKGRSRADRNKMRGWASGTFKMTCP